MCKAWKDTHYDIGPIEIVMITNNQKIYVFPKYHDKINNNFYISGDSRGKSFAENKLREFCKGDIIKQTAENICTFILEESSKSSISIGSSRQYGIDKIFIDKNRKFTIENIEPDSLEKIVDIWKDRIDDWKQKFPLLKPIPVIAVSEKDQIPSER